MLARPQFGWSRVPAWRTSAEVREWRWNSFPSTEKAGQTTFTWSGTGHKGRVVLKGSQAEWRGSVSQDSNGSSTRKSAEMRPNWPCLAVTQSSIDTWPTLYSRGISSFKGRPLLQKARHWNKLKKSFLADVVATVNMEDISPEFIPNWDQTSIKIVPCSMPMMERCDVNEWRWLVPMTSGRS